MKSTYNKPAIDVNVPAGWFDFVTENGGLTGNETAKVFDFDPDNAEIPDPVSDFVKKCVANSFDKSALDFSWSEPIGGVVEKCEVFLEKRSSAPGRIRFETQKIDGEVWRYGYDHTGELVHVGIALPEIK